LYYGIDQNVNIFGKKFFIWNQNQNIKIKKVIIIKKKKKKKKKIKKEINIKKKKKKCKFNKIYRLYSYLYMIY